MSTLFDRLKEVQIGGPIWQPVIFAILVILISVTLYLIVDPLQLRLLPRTE